MKQGKSVKKHNNNTRVVRPERLIYCVFIVSLIFYCGTKILLNSYNITLAAENQALETDIAAKRESISTLQEDIEKLEEKSRLLGVLDGQVAESQYNIYVIEDE
jgi:cell division protein FtsL